MHDPMPSPVPWLLSGMLLLSLAGCATMRGRVERAAGQELDCKPAKLRVQSLGELQLLEPVLRLQVYHAEGCQQERTYYCRSGGTCAARLKTLGIGEAARAAVLRALHIRRTTSRARCPSDAERLVQESQTLYRFETCDGRWLVHCLRRGCEVIGKY
jgi:hypothetical protein